MAGKVRRWLGEHSHCWLMLRLVLRPIENLSFMNFETDVTQFGTCQNSLIIPSPASDGAGDSMVS